MANTLKFKRGLVAGIPTAALGEPLFTTDTFDLYIGNGTTNTRFQKYIASGTTSQLLRGDGSLLTMPIVLTSPANGQVLKYDGTNWVNSSDAGVTGSGTAGQVTYWGSASTITGSNNLFWDATNVRLGIGTNNPAYTFHTISSASTIGAFRNSGAALGQLLVGNTAADLIIRILASGDGLISSDTSKYLAFGSNGGTERMRIFSGGNISINSTTDNGLRFQVTGDGFFSGSVGIGSASFLTNNSLRVAKNITGSNQSYGVSSSGQIQSDVTAQGHYFITSANTQATAFTLSNLYHYSSTQGTFGASSAVTNQYGFFVDSTLIGATNNYGFYGNIASGTGRYNFYANGTANNFMAGPLILGNSALAGTTNAGLILSRNVTGGTIAFGLQNIGTIQSDVTSQANYFITNARTAAATFTLTNLYHFRARQEALGAGSVVTNQYGFLAEETLIDATNDYGFYGNIPSGTGRWNLYMNGTAANYLNGNLAVGDTNFSASWTRVIHVGTSVNNKIAIGHLASSTNGAAIASTNGAISAWAELNFVGTQLVFRSNGETERMRLDASGNLGLGTASPLVVGGYTTLAVNNATNGANIDLMTAGTRHASWNNTATETYFGTRSNTPLIITTNATEVAKFYANGNFRVGAAAADAGFKLDVNGTMRVSGASTFARISASTSGVTLDYNVGILYHYGGSGDYIQYISGANYLMQSRTATGSLQLGTNSTTRLTIASDGAAMFSSSVQAGGGTTNATAILQADSTTRGFLPPRMTTVQKLAIATPAAGLVVYDTTTNKLCCYNGTTWNDLF